MPRAFEFPQITFYSKGIFKKKSPKNLRLFSQSQPATALNFTAVW